MIDLPTNKNRLKKLIKRRCIYVSINTTTKKRRVQFIQAIILGSREDTIWMTIISLTKYV